MKTGKHRGVKRAFTLSEVMLAVGVVAFGLVAVFSILPFGLTAQKDNHEETIIRYEAEYWFAVLKAGGKPLEELNRVDTIELKDATNTVYRINRYDIPTNNWQGVLARESWKKDVCGWLSAPDNRVTAKYARVWAFNGSLFDRLYSPRHQGGHFLTGGEFSFGYLLQSKVEPVGPSATRITLKFWWPITGPVENALSPLSLANPDGGRSIDSIVNPAHDLYDSGKLRPPNEKEFSILTNLQPRPALSFLNLFLNLNQRQSQIMRAGSPGEKVTFADLDDMFPDRKSGEPWDNIPRKVKVTGPATVGIVAYNLIDGQWQEFSAWNPAAGDLQKMLSVEDLGWYLHIGSIGFSEITRIHNPANDFAILGGAINIMHLGRSFGFEISFLKPGETWMELLSVFQGQGLGRLFVDPDTGEDKWEFGSMHNSWGPKYFKIIEMNEVVVRNPKPAPFVLKLQVNDYHPFEAPSMFNPPSPGGNRCSFWFFAKTMKKNHPTRRNGFTLVELMGSVVISMILILLLYKIFDKVQSVFVVSQSRARVMEQGRIAMDMMVRDFQALSPANIYDPNGEVPNISWVEDVSQKTNLFWSIVYEFQPLISPMEDTDPGWPSYRDQGHALEVHWHQCKFFTNDEGWRFVDYKFGGRNHYTTMNPASPVGALWVYRSRGVRRSGLEREQVDHDTLKLHDPLPPNYGDPSYDPGSDSREQDGLVGYSRVVDGVIHFRVRAVSPLDPGGAFASPAISFYTGRHGPSLVEVEIAVVDENLVAEMEAGIEQRMEGQAASVKFQEKLNYIKNNLDRVYFYKQLIHIQGEGQ